VFPLRPEIRRLFRLDTIAPRDASRDVEDEMRHHLERRTEQLMQRGLDPDSAEREARMLFSRSRSTLDALHLAAAERNQQMRITEYWDGWRQDLRYALRALRRDRWMTLFLVVTLALGIGATSTLFTIIDAVLLRPLPFHDPDRIVSLSVTADGADVGQAIGPDLVAWHNARSVTDISPLTSFTAILTGVGDPAQLRGAKVSGGFFSLLGIRPVVGRLLGSNDDVAGAPDVVLLSEPLWRARFASDPAIAGRVILFNGNPVTIVGVVPARQALPQQAEFWMPLRLDSSPAGGFVFYYQVLARLKPGITSAAAGTELVAMSRRAESGLAAGQRTESVVVKTLHERLFGSVRGALMLLFTAVLFLLLIGCANVANLLLARGAARRREVAVRAALGAGKWRLVRQLLLENMLIAFLGAATGVTMPFWAVSLFMKLAPASITHLDGVHVNPAVLLFTAVTGLVTGLLFGAVPALLAVREVRVAPLIGTGARSSPTRAHHRLRKALVVGQLMAALVLMTGAGLFARSFANVLATDIGFQPEHLVVASVNLPRTRYADAARQAAFFDQLLVRTRALPGVASVALTDGVPPLGMVMTAPISATAHPDDSARVAVSRVDRNYPRTVGVELLSGRLFDATDLPGTEPVVVISASAAHALFPGQSAVGAHVEVTEQVVSGRQAVVIGVVKDVPSIGLEGAPLPHVYFSREQVGGGLGAVALRITEDPALLEAQMRAAVAAVDPLQPLSSLQQVDQVLSRSIAPRRLNFLVVVIFALLALLLAAIGLYGIMAYGVTQRTREMGIRMALGATGGRVRGLVLREGMGLMATGVIGGVAMSLALSRVVATFLYGVGAHDALTYAVAPAVLILVGAMACYLPARRATRVDPMVALRGD
jgi:putative ABC transport system permease protein